MTVFPVHGRLASDARAKQQRQGDEEAEWD